ncbi:MAG: hypothetical protein EAZ95_00030 [Bacteroidetes bacterium]|nr:MAG: hypothetical protein EAZ95_00030 [Bacteroidota bacterium]
MKTKILLTLALCLSMMTVAFAQGKGKGNGKGNGNMKDRTAEERATAHTNHLEKKLGLSADQKSQVYAINLEAAKQQDELRAQAKTAGADKKAIAEKRKAVNKDRVSKIEALLTGDQKTKWEAVKAAQKARVEARRKAKGKPMKNSGEELEDDGDDD